MTLIAHPTTEMQNSTANNGQEKIKINLAVSHEVSWFINEIIRNEESLDKKNFWRKVHEKIDEGVGLSGASRNDLLVDFCQFTDARIERAKIGDIVYATDHSYLPTNIDGGPVLSHYFSEEFTNKIKKIFSEPAPRGYVCAYSHSRFALSPHTLKNMSSLDIQLIVSNRWTGIGNNDVGSIVKDAAVKLVLFGIIARLPNETERFESILSMLMSESRYEILRDRLFTFFAKLNEAGIL